MSSTQDPQTASVGTDLERNSTTVEPLTDMVASGETEGQIEEKAEKLAGNGPQPDAHVILDGGLQAWAAVAGSWLVSMTSFGYINAYGVYQTYYVETLLPSYSASAISWIGSLQLCLLFLLGLLSGRLFDAGYFRHLMIGGGILYVGCIFAQSAAHPDAYYQIFLSQALGQGLGLGILYLPSLAILGQHFRKRRSLAMGIAVSGSSLGGIIFPIMLNNLFQNIGYKWTVRVIGFYMLGALTLANLLMYPRPNPLHKNLKPPSVMKLLRDPPYVVAIAGTFLISLGIYFVFFYIQLFTVVHDISATLSFYTLAILNAASILGRTMPNLLADMSGPLTMVIPASVITGALIFALLGVSTAAGVVVFALLYGFFSGAYVSLIGPVFTSMADDMSEIGIRMGVAFGILGFAALIGTPIDGALLGGGPDYAWWKAVIFSSIIMLAGCSLLGVSWVLLRKKKNQRWV